MKHIWQKDFAAFAGPGIHQPSDAMRVTDSEALSRIAELARLAWSPPVHSEHTGRPDYRVCNACNTWNTALFHGERLVGFYAGSYLWIALEHRGSGLSTPLILAAAEQRGGSIMPPGIVCQGYTPGGLAAHRAAHRAAVLAALAAKLPVPSAVIDEIRRYQGHPRFGRQAA